MVKGSGLRYSKDDEVLLNGIEQSLCRSVVGSMLYITKHSSPDLCNSVRELSKSNQNLYMGSSGICVQETDLNI